MREYEKKIFFFNSYIPKPENPMTDAMSPSSIIWSDAEKKVKLSNFPSFFYSHNLNETDKLYVTLKITLFNF